MSVKKLASLSFALALVYSISLPARAELLKNLKLDGSLETRSFSIDNEIDRNSNADDHRGETNTRMMFGASYDLLDDVHGRFLLDRSPRLGTGAPSVEGVEASLVFDNASVKIDKVFGHVDLTIGKQFYGNSNDVNIYFGPQDDDLLSVTSVDLFRADADIMGWAKFQGIAGKTADAATGVRGTNTDTDLFGGEVNTDKVIPSGSLAAYYYTAQVHAVKPPATGNNTLSVTGVRAGGDVPVVAGLGYNAEYLQNFGRNNTIVPPAGGTNAYDGSAYIVGAHYGREMGAGYPLRVHGEYARGSRDFAAIAPGRRFGIIWGRFSNFGGDASLANRGAGGATGLSNLKVIDAGLGTTCPKTHIGLDLNWYRFLYVANVAGVGTSAGTEYDLILSYKHSENVSFEVSAATFQVGTSLQNAAPTSTAPETELGADVKIKF